MTNYLDENGRRITTIGQIYINGSAQLLGIPGFSRNSGLLFIENLQDPTMPTGWGHGDNSNNNWGPSPGGTYSMWSVAQVTTTPAYLDYMPRSPDNLRAAARRICDDFLCCRCYECMRSPTTSHNTIVNLRINHCGDDWEVPVTQ